MAKKKSIVAKKNKTFELMYDFMVKNTLGFTASSLGTSAGIKESSAKTYLSKKLVGVYVEKRGGKYFPMNLNKLSSKQFVEYMSQKSEDVIDASRQIHEKLKDRAVDSFFLAIEIYNRVTQKNKTEAFSMLIVNAWELLLKSYIGKEKGIESIYYKEDPQKSLSITDCLKHSLKENDPVRLNLEKIIELRDKAIHLLIPEVNFDLSRLFQSCVFNFVDFVSGKFQENLSVKFNAGIIALLVDETSKPDFEKISNSYGKKTSDELKEFLHKFKADEKNIGNDAKFAIPIEYKLALTKRKDGGDIQLSKASGSGENGLIIEVAKDIDKTHIFSMKTLIEAVNNEKDPSNLETLTSHKLQAVLYKEGIKKSKLSEYHYHIENPSIHKYSTKFKEFILYKIKKDTSYIAKCVESYNTHLKKNRVPRKPKK